MAQCIEFTQSIVVVAFSNQSRVSIDERAGKRDVAGGGKDHYYLLKDLYSVAGLAAANGRLEEAYVYDTYGEAVIEGRPVRG